jgi:hypothetical protein
MTIEEWVEVYGWLDEFADELAFQDFYGSVQDRQTDVP